MIEYSDNAKEIYRRLYLAEGEETPQDTHERVARFIANTDTEYEDFKFLLDNKIFRPNTPTLIAAGIKGNNEWDKNLSGCFVLGMDDSMESIIEVWSTCSKIYAGGAGSGIPITNLREKGSHIGKNKGQASGPLKYLHVIESVANTVKSGGRHRRASNLASAKYNHPDIFEIIDAKLIEDNLRSFNISILVDDWFMKHVKLGRPFDVDLVTPNGGNVISTVNGMDIWKKIVENAHKSGDPGLLFYDTANRVHPYPDEEIVSSNPCVSGDTYVLTKKGNLPISEFDGKEIEIWNGFEWSTVIPYKTGRNKKLYNVEIRNLYLYNTYSLLCTDYHQFVLKDGTRVPTIKLFAGDELLTWYNPFEHRYIEQRVESIKETELHEDVYCFTEPIKHTAIFNNILTGQCGEVLLPPWSICNLGSINLSKCISYEKNNKPYFDFSLLIQYAEIATRFMDNVIDKNGFVHEKFKERALKERPIGLGIMSLSDVLFELGIPYNSGEARDLFSAICKTLTTTAFETSVQLAKEKGSVEIKNKEHFISLLRQYTGDEILVDNFRLHGIRNSTVTSIAPTGCLHPESMILTSEGLLPIKDICKYSKYYVDFLPWNEINTPIDVLQKEGKTEISAFFNGGLCKTKKITTYNKYEIEGTTNHKLEVIDIDGNVAWKKIEDITLKDLICFRLGGHDEILFDKPYVQLKVPQLSNHRLKDPNIILPSYLDEDLGFILGYYMGNGSIHTDGIRMNVGGDHINSGEELNRCFFNVFKKSSKYEEKHKGKNCVSFYFNSRDIVSFFAENKFVKEKGNNGEGAASAFIPDQILRSKTSVVCSFLKGLFDSDGSCYQNNKSNCVYVSFSTVSKKLAFELKNLLFSLGIVTNTHIHKRDNDNAYGNRDIYDISIKSVYDVSIFKEKIGFVSDHKKSILQSCDVKEEKGRILRNSALWKDMLDNMISVLDKNDKANIRMNIKGNRGSLLFARKILDRFPEFYKKTKIGNLLKGNIYIDSIVSIDDSFSQTYDITVPNNNYYLANGIISHNSISISSDCSYSFEPCFALVWTKELAETHELMYFVNPIFEKWVDEEYVNSRGLFTKEELFKEIMRNNGSIQNIIGIPDHIKEIFVTAHDITYLDKLKMQQKGQEYITLGISSTCNLKNSATIDDVNSAFINAWEYGLKGITVYRDGCKSWQPVNFNSKLECKEEIKPEPKEYIRPIKSTADHFEHQTPNGKMHITICRDDNNKIFQVLIRVGKQGTLINLLLDALSRCISNALQENVPLSVFAKTLRDNKDSPFWVKLNKNDEKSTQVESIVDLLGIIFDMVSRENAEKVEVKLDNGGESTYIKMERCPSCGEYSIIRDGSCKSGRCTNEKCLFTSCG